MAQARKEQVNKLAKAHQDQFLSLVSTNSILIKGKTLASLPANDKRRIAWEKLRDVLKKQVKTWVARNTKMAKAILLKEGVRPEVLKALVLVPENAFLNEVKGLPLLNETLKKWNLPGGLGEPITLIVIGVLILASLFTASVIADELTVTAEEQAEMTNAQGEFVKSMSEAGLSTEQIQQNVDKMFKVQETTVKGTGLMSDIGTAVKWVGGIGAVFLAAWGGKKIYDYFK